MVPADLIETTFASALAMERAVRLAVIVFAPVLLIFCGRAFFRFWKHVTRTMEGASGASRRK